ncbi:MAG: ATP-dependent helicase [Candidatus Peribacter sp.]|jgi:DNA helicase II / ATP-dependent DNA helicase PcrA|nr:ATP-dependent helicase [Candidatus Peribacter sp.]MBT4392612.1 ATP-dependent helicase [Candidatus Peribacter sp.]MBT4600418.1 ATP-dependent helicase [Candidatus Peribacter sp.]MBT5149090.1 ATP-dependent helicase [Candidatus Peribacter sp.]MBT5637566.1 ATP-dependent helicase [Candidatus Peribacter sp.]
MIQETATSAGNATKNAVKKLAAKTGKTFETEYAKLNSAQKIAVDTIQGPVMVVAGPGTGKTQVLALRTAKILQSTQMNPWNILCLTFSKSGATAMRNRLRDIIGSDAYGVTVNTIHGFCNDIITAHPSVFEDWSSLEQISDVERYRSLNKIIDQLLPDMVLVNPKSPYTRSRDILGRISQLKIEGVTNRDQLLAIAGEYDSVMQSKSKEGTKAHARNLLTAKKFREFIDIFDRYQQMLKETGRYDYADMILNVTEALKQEDWLLASLQERYQYVLVDEFQDTNGSQFAFIDLLTTDPTGDASPNFFVVGDDDQAIYRFQGANLTNILSFTDKYPHAPVIALTQSYRCTQPILDAAESLISQNTERLVGKIENLDKHLVAALQKDGTPPQMVFSASDMAEPWVIADMVDDRLREGIDPNEIAIIVQTNRELLSLYDVFKARQIPTVLSGKLDLLEHPLVEQTLAILRAVHNPHDDHLLSSALASSCFSCHPADLSLLYSVKREEKCTLLECALKVDTQEMNLREQELLIKARDIILDLHHKKDQRTVVETLEHIYRESNLLGSLQSGEMDVLDFAAGQEFFDRIKSRAYEQPHFTFEVFLNDLEYYGDANYSDLRLTYDLPHLTESGVQMMTAHKSKGLEFHTVIIANFREGHWDKRRNPPSVAMPEDLLFGWEKDQKSYEKNQDERRVSFVAMTRAKRELIFSCPIELTSGDSTKTVSPSGFFAESGDLPEVHRDVAHPDQMSTLLSVPPREFDAEFAAFLQKRIEHFALSPTALNHFLEDPLQFLEVDLLQKPQAKEPHFAYGNAVHHVLAKWADSVTDGNPLDEQTILTTFDDHLSQRELLTKKELERLSHLGHQTLKRYISSHLQSPYPNVHKVEYPITTHLGDVPIKGKLDRIDLMEPNSRVAIVTDFKTGKPKTEKQIVDYGYYRQLVFYDLLIRNGYSIIDPKEFRLEFVGEGAEAPITRSFTISENDRKELSELINTVWQKILALDFTEV